MKIKLTLFIGMIAGLLLGSEPDFTWLDQARPDAYTLPELNDGYGVLFRDFDGDSYPDIYLVRFRNLNRFFLNDPQTHSFTDATINSGLGGNLYPGGLTNLELGVSMVDVDNDGATELMITGWNTTTDLLVRNRPMHFRSRFKGWNPEEPLDGNANVWADVDRDGDLDLFITDEHHGNHLYIQNDGRQLIESAKVWNVTGGKSVSQGAAFGDLNGDGWPDLYVCNWFVTDSLYLNLQGAGFRAIALPVRHLQEALNSNSVTFADLNRDGRLDLIVCDRNGESAVYENESGPNGSFFLTDQTEAWGLKNTIPAYGAIVGDLNRDGSPDVFFTDLGANRFYSGAKDGRFQLAWEETPKEGHYSTGSALADVDRDGDLDLLIANKDTTCELRINPIRTGHWLKVELEGVRSNRDAIGTTVTLWDSTHTNRLGFQERSSSSGYLSQSDPTLFFGLADRGPVWVQVKYPSGIRREISTPVDRKVRLPEITGIERATIFGTRELKARLSESLFWSNLFRILLALAIWTGFLFLAGSRYRWSAWPMFITFFVLAILIYLVAGLITSPTAEKVLKTVLGSEILALGILTIILEQKHRSDLKRARVRQTLQKFSDDIALLHDDKELADELVTVCREQLHLKQSALWIRQNGRFVRYASAGDGSELPDRLTQDRIQSLENGDDEDLPFRTVLFLRYKSEIEGVWGLTESRERPWRLDSEDISLLQFLADTAAMAIRNNRYIAQVTEQERQLAQQAEREKMISELEGKNKELERLFQELKSTQAQLVHQEKMSALGQLVAGIAHELNNPIGFIYSNIKLLEEQIQSVKSGGEWTGETDELINEITEGSSRIRDLVRDLRNFSRLDEAEFKSADLHEGLDSTLTLLRGEFKGRITVHKEYGKLPPVVCLPGHLNQVFLNLLMNASQAIGDSGEIWIKTSLEGDSVKIEIKDNGGGIPEEVLDKLFEPFVTTKPVGQGTGLGLSISYGIIQRHGGSISAENWKNGSVFTLELPVNPELEKK